MMRDFANAVTMGGGTATVAGAASGQLIIGAIGLVFMIGFGLWSSYLRLKDSRALRKALENQDLNAALKIRSKP